MPIIFVAEPLKNASILTDILPRVDTTYNMKGVRFARAGEAVAPQYHDQWNTDTTVCGGFTLVIFGTRTQAYSGKNALLY